MRIVLLTLVLVAAGLFLFRKSGKEPGLVISPPSPPLTKQEALLDRPVWTDFEVLGFTEVTLEEAEGFSPAATRGGAGLVWISNLKKLRVGDSIQISGPLLGKTGLCDWYRFRILDPLGREVVGFGRAGPRKVGQVLGARQVSQSQWISRIKGLGSVEDQAQEVRGDYSEFLTSDDPAYRSPEAQHEEDLAALKAQIQKAMEERGARGKKQNPAR